MMLPNTRMGVPGHRGHAKWAGKPASGPFYHAVARSKGFDETEAAAGAGDTLMHGTGSAEGLP